MSHAVIIVGCLRIQQGITQHNRRVVGKCEGMLAGVFAAATVLALGQTLFEALGRPQDGHRAGPVERLPEPDENLRTRFKEWKAPIWQEGTAKDIIERARRASPRIKK